MALDFDIAYNIKTLLEEISFFGETPTVEFLRRTSGINGRYPYIKIVGPITTPDPELNNISVCTFEFEFRTYIDYDDSSSEDLPYTEYTKDINWQIIRKLLDNPTLNGTCEKINIMKLGYDFDLDTNFVELFNFVSVEVEATVNNQTLGLY